MKRTIWLMMCAAALLAVSCGKRDIPPALLPTQPEAEAPPGMAPVFAEPEITDEADETVFGEYVFPHRIMVPYTKEYLSPGQETRIAVLLENGDYGDETLFECTREPGKNSIRVDGKNNVAVIKAIGEGEQYLRISHPKAPESRFIVYDVLPPSPPPPPEIDVSESPLILRKDETRPLQLILRNASAAGSAGAGASASFQFQVIENAYAIEVRQRDDTLHITGIAPGAGKIRIQHPSALRDYDVMVIVG
jgi:hypothetical protein